MIPFRTVLIVAVLHDDAYPRAICVPGIETTVIARIVDAGFALALAFNTGETAAESRLGAVADVGVLVGQARRSAILAEGTGVAEVV